MSTTTTTVIVRCNECTRPLEFGFDVMYQCELCYKVWCDECDTNWYSNILSWVNKQCTGECLALREVDVMRGELYAMYKYNSDKLHENPDENGCRCSDGIRAIRGKIKGDRALVCMECLECDNPYKITHNDFIHYLFEKAGIVSEVQARIACFEFLQKQSVVKYRPLYVVDYIYLLVHSRIIDKDLMRILVDLLYLI